MNSSDLLTPEIKKELVEFAQSLVRTKSLSGQEEAVIKLIEKKMIALGYDEVTIDSMGNILGRIGNGEKSILFDSHVDTVEVKDESKWVLPFTLAPLQRKWASPPAKQCMFPARYSKRIATGKT